MDRIILHIDFNSFFASVEQQANPHWRGKPIGVTGGDRMTRTVLGTASIEAKKMGVKTGMPLWEAKKICPQIIIVPGDSDKYLYITTKFLNILKDFSPYVEVFSIDECFLELPMAQDSVHSLPPVVLAQEIKFRIHNEIGEYITCSIGISYNKLMAKLAGSLQKPDGLVVIGNEDEAMEILNNIPLDGICGIGFRIKQRLNKMGIFNFKNLRAVPLDILLLEFKSYGHFLYNAARGIDHRPIMPFYEKEEVKSIGHRHTIDHDTDDSDEIRQILLKLTELIARRLRAKKLVGRTISCWYRSAFNSLGVKLIHPPGVLEFDGESMQTTIPYTNDGLEIFKAGWKIFKNIWNENKIRMIGVSISNLKPQNPMNLTFLEDIIRQEKIIKAIDKINNKYGEFTLQRGILLGSSKVHRMANPFLSDHRFKLWQ